MMLRRRSQSLKITVSHVLKPGLPVSYLGIVAIGPVKDQLGENEVVWHLVNHRVVNHVGDGSRPWKLMSKLGSDIFTAGDIVDRGMRRFSN